MSVTSFAASLIGLALGNLAVALPLGLVAWWLQRRGTMPYLAHLLWLIVLIKLVTPALYSLPLLEARVPAPQTPPLSVAVDPGAWLDAAVAPAPRFVLPDWRAAVVAIWLLGSAILAIGSLLKARRFDRLLRATSVAAEASLQQAAAALARMLGLRTTPVIMATVAQVSPMVWWFGRQQRVYLPRTMLERLDPAEMRSILAHEIGHLRRGDHWVRWLEWFVAVALWWNPVAWWARRNLRVCEEICCDALVLERTECLRHAYAGALISAMEILSVPTPRPSTLASHVDGGFIERRIKMILSGKSVSSMPRGVRVALLAAMALILPLGFGFAQPEDDLDSVRQWLESGVNSAFLTQEQADIMLRALDASKFQLAATLVDGEGNYINVRRIAVPRVGIAVDAATGQVGLEQALALAETHFAEAVAAGELSQEEADALLEDLSHAHATGLANFTLRRADVDGGRTVTIQAVPVATELDLAAPVRVEVIREEIVE